MLNYKESVHNFSKHEGVVTITVGEGVVEFDADAFSLTRCVFYQIRLSPTERDVEFAVAVIALQSVTADEQCQRHAKQQRQGHRRVRPVSMLCTAPHSDGRAHNTRLPYCY